MEFEVSEKDRAAMAAMDAQIRAEEREEELKRKEVLSQVKSIVSEKVYAEILVELADSSFTFDYLIADRPIGTEVDNEAAWGKHYVNQTTDGGMSGDEFAGTVSIPLGDGRFFQFGYAM